MDERSVGYSSGLAAKVSIGPPKTYAGREARLREKVREALKQLEPGPCRHGVQCDGCVAEWLEAIRILRAGLDAD